MRKTLLLALTFLALFSCTKEEPTGQTPLTAVLKSDINANHSTFQYFSFVTGDTIPAADSSTTNWDIAFKGTTVILNSGISGTGNAGVVILDAIFSEVTEAPTTGYAQDSNSSLAIPAGSNNGWYNYAGPPNHTITPLAGKVFVIRTALGNYAKMEFISYYKGAPAEPNGLTDESRYFTIRYVYQPDGTTNLE
ncbi:MAG: HmuY family protein [Chitinophagales bacterium]